MLYDMFFMNVPSRFGDYVLKIITFLSMPSRSIIVQALTMVGSMMLVNGAIVAASVALPTFAGQVPAFENENKIHIYVHIYVYQC